MCRSERWAARWYELQEGSGAVSRLQGAARVAIVCRRGEESPARAVVVERLDCFFRSRY